MAAVVFCGVWSAYALGLGYLAWALVWPVAMFVLRPLLRFRSLR
jgi:hypothetical protein